MRMSLILVLYQKGDIWAHYHQQELNLKQESSEMFGHVYYYYFFN